MEGAVTLVESAHKRFSQQANWTESLRKYLFKQVTLPVGANLLEVGCGTGAILSRLDAYTQGVYWGLDKNLPSLQFARQAANNALLVGGDGARLPFRSASFHAVLSHFLFLWVADAGVVLAEMIRVTRPGGAVIALAEPDYGARIDYPDELAGLGSLQAIALQHQGADPEMGRRLPGLFHNAGLIKIETGILGGQWLGPPSTAAWKSEWETLESDLAGLVAPKRLEQLKALDSAAYQSGERVLFVPTFYAVGYKPVE
jgi:SAM-dependent methyltransferase